MCVCVFVCVCLCVFGVCGCVFLGVSVGVCMCICGCFCVCVCGWLCVSVCVKRGENGCIDLIVDHTPTCIFYINTFHMLTIMYMMMSQNPEFLSIG